MDIKHLSTFLREKELTMLYMIGLHIESNPGLVERKTIVTNETNWGFVSSKETPGTMETSTAESAQTNSVVYCLRSSHNN